MSPRVCVIGAGPCGLTALKNLLEAGVRDVVCYERHSGIGGNWAFSDDPARATVHDCTHLISSRQLSSYHDFPMPARYPDFPSHRQVLAYFVAYADAFDLMPHIRLGSSVQRCALGEDGRWLVRVVADGAASSERFDAVVVCSGHHREPFVPLYPGTFAGDIVHSSGYKRADPYRGRRVLVVGGGNSAADVAVDLAPVAGQVALSLRSGVHFVPKRMLGRPIDTLYLMWGRLPDPLVRTGLRLWLRCTVGRWSDYGLPTPAEPLLARPPTVNSAVLDELRQRRVTVRPGIRCFADRTVHFVDGGREEFDAVIMCTGFRTSFPFLSSAVTHSPLFLRLMHPTVPGLFFIGLFQPIGCIWRLADLQARIVALQLSGRGRCSGGDDGRFPSLEVDYHRFRRALVRDLRGLGKRVSDPG